MGSLFLNGNKVTEESKIIITEFRKKMGVILQNDYLIIFRPSPADNSKRYEKLLKSYKNKSNYYVLIKVQNKIKKFLVDKKTIEKRLDEKLHELQHKVHLKGFRPGKVPKNVIKSQFGKAIYGEV